MNIEMDLIVLVNEIVGLPTQDVENIKMLADNREWGVAWDSLCNQIYEFDVNISENQYNRIKEIGEELKMESNLLSMLKEQIK